ncbi:MAG: hypothetical protein WBI40_09510 [Methylococcaceae bacterium]
MSDELDFDYQPPVQTETTQVQPTRVSPVSEHLTQKEPQNQQVATMPVMPNLQEAKESDVSLGSEYWTPQQSGESKRGIVIGFETQPYDKVDDRTGEVTQIELKVLIFAEQRPDLSWKRIANGGKRLVATVENAVNSGSILPFKTPVQIKYLGKRKNSTNGFSTDDFEVKTLVI